MVGKLLFTLMNKNKEVLVFGYDFEYTSYLGIKKVINLAYALLPLKIMLLI